MVGVQNDCTTHTCHLTGPACSQCPTTSASKRVHCATTVAAKASEYPRLSLSQALTTPQLSPAPPMLSQAPDHTLHLLHCVQVVGGCHTCNVHVCCRHLSTGGNTQHTLTQQPERSLGTPVRSNTETCVLSCSQHLGALPAARCLPQQSSGYPHKP